MPNNFRSESKAAAPSPPPLLTELCGERDHCLFGHANIAISFSVNEPTAAYLAVVTEAMTQHARDYPKGLGMLILIDASAEPPSEVARRAVKQSLFDMAPVLRAAVQVVEGHGFLASAKRSAITVINLTSQYAFPVKVAGTVAEGAPMIMKMLGAALDPSVSATSIAAATESVRSQFAARRRSA